MPQRLLLLAAFLLVPSLVHATSLRVDRIDASGYPLLRAYVSLVGHQGVPIGGLTREDFKVYELKKNEVAPLRVQPLDQSGEGAAIVVVVQTGGGYFAVLDELRKATGGFFTSLGEHDQAALVAYSDRVDPLAPLGDKASASAAAAKISEGSDRLLFDGLTGALDLFTGANVPNARALIVVSDGVDKGSTADLERVLSAARRLGVPVYAIGHSQMDGRSLDVLRDLSTRSIGAGHAYFDAPGAEDLARGFGRFRDLIARQYVVEWKADELRGDGRRHPVEIAVEAGNGRLRGASEVEMPVVRDYTTPIVIAVSLLLLGALGVVVWLRTRPAPAPTVHCAMCRREQMPGWTVCLFCEKQAKARLEVVDGPLAGRVYPLVGKLVRLGKGPENHHRLPDPAVSTNHCGIRAEGDRFEVVDQNSANGTFVNGRRVQRRFLRNGDVLTLGRTELRFVSSFADDEPSDLAG